VPQETIGEIVHWLLRDKLSIRDIRAKAYALALSAKNANAGLSRLSRLRRELRNLGALPTIVEAMKFPDFTGEANKIQRDNQKKAEANHIDYPDHFMLESVKERLDSYNISTVPDIQALTDVIIMLCIRPTELITLHITNTGVTGYAKNREYDLIPKYLRKMGAVYSVVTHKAKNIAHAYTIAGEYLSSPDAIAKDIGVPELDPCSKCNQELFLYEIKKPFTILTCGHIFHRNCLEHYAKDLSQCPKCAIEIEPIVNTPSTTDLMQISPQLVSGQSQDTIISEAMVFRVSNPDLSSLPLYPEYMKQAQKRSGEDTTKNKLFSKKPKQNKEKGDKKDSNTIRKLIVELSSNNTEQTTSDTNNSYPVTATETDPQPIDFLNLYTKITSVESEIQKPNQNIIIQYYNFGLGIAKRFKFYYEKSYNVNDANSEVKKEIKKQLPDGTSETTIQKRKERAQKIFHLFSKIETDKIGRAKSFSALMIAKLLTVDQINHVIFQIPDKIPIESFV
ncbi:6076_t:CDS:2, partial [Gigaspora margarita]